MCSPRKARARSVVLVYVCVCAFKIYCLCGVSPRCDVCPRTCPLLTKRTARFVVSRCNDARICESEVVRILLRSLRRVRTHTRDSRSRRHASRNCVRACLRRRAAACTRRLAVDDGKLNYPRPRRHRRRLRVRFMSKVRTRGCPFYVLLARCTRQLCAVALVCRTSRNCR